MKANVEKADVGPKAPWISFRDNVFANPAGPCAGSPAKARRQGPPDHKVVVIPTGRIPANRMKGTAALMILLARLAAEGEKAAA